MVAESRIAEKEGEQVRDETLPLNKIDLDYLETLIEDQVEGFRNSHEDYFGERRDWLLALRDLRYNYKEGYFDHAADLHVPYTLIMSKAMHARIFQVFSQQGFFDVEAQNIGFQDREELITRFMNWVTTKWMNRGEGKQGVIDHWIQEIIDEGSGVLKLMWDRWEHTYLDVDLDVEEAPTPEIFASEEGVEFGETSEVKAKFKNVKKHTQHGAPAAAVVLLDDFYMPAGRYTVQNAPWIAHRVKLRDEDLKLRTKQKKFDKDVVEEAIERRRSRHEIDRNDTKETRRPMRELEGINRELDSLPHHEEQGFHDVFEWYGRAYVDEDVDRDTMEDVKKLPQEIVVWYHRGIRKILGWTYLHRISPSGRRPFYKADFMPSKERAFGIGVGELLWSLNNHIDAVHNLKLDNGVLSSLQFGVYRSGSTLKPDTFKISPGDLIPVDDVNDIKFASVPYLGQFGENEELALTGYGEKLLAINDINLGNLTGRGVAGALRNATGASFVDRQANIQLHPHLDRISRELSFFLSDLFIMTRSRMSDQLFFRVTGEDGKGVFGEVSRDDLRGDFDFIIDVALAASSEAERQQRASLMLQTTLNQTFMQTGIIQPGNLYEILKEFLVRHQVRNPDKFITKPPQYAGPPLTAQQRIFKVLMGQTENPPIEASVRPEENHEAALQIYQEFQDSDLFGNLNEIQVVALQEIIDAHTNFQTTLQGGGAGVPNIAGTQLPGQGGLQALGPEDVGVGGAEGGPLGSPEGEVNGPVF